MKHWDLVWGIPIIVGLVYFAIMETWALTHRRPDRTLSNRLKAWLGIDPPNWWRRDAIGLVLIFFSWFGPHILS